MLSLIFNRTPESTSVKNWQRTDKRMQINNIAKKRLQSLPASHAAFLLSHPDTQTRVGFCARWAVLRVPLDFSLLPGEPGSSLREKQAAIAQRG